MPDPIFPPTPNPMQPHGPGPDPTLPDRQKLERAYESTPAEWQAPRLDPPGGEPLPPMPKPPSQE